MRGAAALVMILLEYAAVPAPAVAASPEEVANFCYDRAKKMGQGSRGMADRYWEECMAQFRQQQQPAQAPPPQQTQQPATNPGLEFGRGVQRGLCNSQGGYYTSDGQCINKTPPPVSQPSWRCTTIGSTTTCNPH